MARFEGKKTRFSTSFADQRPEKPGDKKDFREKVARIIDDLKRGIRERGLTKRSRSTFPKFDTPEEPRKTGPISFLKSLRTRAATKYETRTRQVSARVRSTFPTIDVPEDSRGRGPVSFLKSLRSRMPGRRTPASETRARGSFPSGRGHGKRRSFSLPVGNLPDSVISFISSLYDRVRSSRPLLIGIGCGILAAMLIILVMDYRKVRALSEYHPNAGTKIYDRNGELVSELFSQKRDVVPLKKIPPHVVHAFIAIEDANFYDHLGISPSGIVRAFFINLFAGRVRQGGSTITQQLAKILLTTRERSIFRKVKEAFIALMIEATYSKDHILEMYLNQIFLGHGAYGVESASQIYFGKSVSELNLAESALLATLPSAPNMYSPLRHTKISAGRHKIVLARMVEMGYITVPQAEKAYLDFWPAYNAYINDMPPTMTTMSARINRAPWFTELVRRHLVKKYGSEMVFEQGLHVYTTLDVKKQEIAQEVLKKHLRRQSDTSGRLAFKNEDIVADYSSDLVELFSMLADLPRFRKRGSRENEKINTHFRAEIVEEFEGLNFLAGMDVMGKFLDRYKSTYFQDRDLQNVEGCIVSIDQRNGYIEALVGGSEFSGINQLNRVMQSYRQPGSAIKPIIYSAAIESRQFTPATLILDSPLVFLDTDGGDWIPENYEGDYSGFVPLRRALAMSVNVVSVNITQKLGIEYVIKYMAKLLRMDKSVANRRIRRDYSIALGSVEVSPLELTRAYAIIANGGKDVIPFYIRYVKDRDGKILENREEEVQKLLENEEKDGTIQILKPETSQIMISLMKSVINGGTGGAAGCGRPAAGKTGTTSSWKDAWFVGFTPQVTTGIWIGYDRLGMSLGPGQAGGSISAPIFGEYMREALKGEPVLDFPTFAGLASKTVCERSGMLPSGSCRKTIDEIFVPGTIPEKVCDICSGAGHLDVPNHIPKENISRQQRDSIIRNIRKRKETRGDLDLIE